MNDPTPPLNENGTIPIVLIQRTPEEREEYYIVQIAELIHERNTFRDELARVRNELEKAEAERETIRVELGNMTKAYTVSTKNYAELQQRTNEHYRKCVDDVNEAIARIEDAIEEQKTRGDHNMEMMLEFKLIGMKAVLSIFRVGKPL